MWGKIAPLMIALSLVATGCAGWLAAPSAEGHLEPSEVLAAARTGDGRAAFLAYKRSTTDGERRYWICIAANRDLPKAQAELARLHWHSFWYPQSIFGHDGKKAYIWSIIAVQRHQPLEHMERRLGATISGVERWRATLLALAWRPDPAQCQNMENSEYYSLPPIGGDGQIAEEVLAAAKGGDARAAFLAYKQATTDGERRYWVCIAANGDLPEAQVELARLHRQSSGDLRSPFARDQFTAYIWSIIAVHRRQPIDEVEKRLGVMSPGVERWRAMALAVTWHPDPSQCDHMENSPYFSGFPVGPR